MLSSIFIIGKQPTTESKNLKLSEKFIASSDCFIGRKMMMVLELFIRIVLKISERR